MVLNLDFSSKGCGAMSRQFDCGLWVDLDAVRMVLTRYEALWLLPALCDLLTRSSVGEAAAHLVRVVEARLALG